MSSADGGWSLHVAQSLAMLRPFYIAGLVMIPVVSDLLFAAQMQRS